jgi:hypothetical protein
MSSSELRHVYKIVTLQEQKSETDFQDQLRDLELWRWEYENHYYDWDDDFYDPPEDIAWWDEYDAA